MLGDKTFKLPPTLSQFFKIILPALAEPLQNLKETFDCILDSSHLQSHSRNKARSIVFFVLQALLYYNPLLHF